VIIGGGLYRKTKSDAEEKGDLSLQTELVSSSRHDGHRKIFDDEAHQDRLVYDDFLLPLSALGERGWG
jgi:hypothetical protein